MEQRAGKNRIGGKRKLERAKGGAEVRCHQPHFFGLPLGQAWLENWVAIQESGIVGTQRKQGVRVEDQPGLYSKCFLKTINKIRRIMQNDVCVYSHSPLTTTVVIRSVRPRVSKAEE